MKIKKIHSILFAILILFITIIFIIVKLNEYNNRQNARDLLNTATLLSAEGNQESLSKNQQNRIIDDAFSELRWQVGICRNDILDTSSVNSNKDNSYQLSLSISSYVEKCHLIKVDSSSVFIIGKIQKNCDSLMSICLQNKMYNQKEREINTRKIDFYLDTLTSLHFEVLDILLQKN